MHGRTLPWRQPEVDGSFDPYKILVSEIMLQQTQVNRVIPKYQAFLEAFPNVKALAAAPLSAVLALWNGLGYNRRAKYLHEAAKQLAPLSEPWTVDELAACKGIGTNTAAAVVTYAYNQSIPFIETNIRTVFIHHFFKDAEVVSDKELTPLVAAALEREHSREWYWALMDYGSHLKVTVGNVSRMSKHYARQSKFHGSKRQLRGYILRVLIEKPHTRNELAQTNPDDRLEAVVADLLQEGLVMERYGRLFLGSTS